MKVHFVGVGGAGMSALAQLRAMEGSVVTGSDRLADRDGLGENRLRLETAGVRFFPQDGSGVTADTARVVVSTAIEEDNLDIRRARELGVPIVHRADELAAVAGSRRTVAVGGTSGKSTVTAMVFHVLETLGRSPSLVTGANIPALRRKGLVGNAWLGTSDLLVIEADESDGTLTRYRPALGLLLNVTKDHKELHELMELFRVFRDRSEKFVVNADPLELDEFCAKAVLTYGFTRGDLRATDLSLQPHGSRFRAGGARFSIPQPGKHNAQNALAAAAACSALGVELAAAAAALESFEGVGRRFEQIGVKRGVEVVDDFAHNPEKVKAAIEAARLRAKRVLAIFQLHGFAPARFMRKEFADAFAEALGPDDTLWLPEIYYVGGTAAKDISAKDYAADLTARGRRAFYEPDRAELVKRIAAEAREGDLVLVMGARDPTLTDLAKKIFSAL